MKRKFNTLKIVALSFGSLFLTNPAFADFKIVATCETDSGNEWTLEVREEDIVLEDYTVGDIAVSGTGTVEVTVEVSIDGVEVTKEEVNVETTVSDPDLSGVSVSDAYWRARKNGKGKYTGDYDDVFDEWEARCDTNPDEDPYDWTIESDSFSL